MRHLLHSKEFKVRLQAAIFLAKLRDPSTVKPLMRCVENDEHYLVRAFCAAALGRIGKLSALPVLRRAQHDASEFVRKRAKQAVERIETLSGGGKGYQVKYKPAARVFVLVNTERNKHHRVARRIREFMDRNLRLQLNQLPALEVARAGVEIPEPWLKKRRIPTLKVDIVIERVRRSRGRREVAVWTKLRAIVTRHPAKAVVVIATTEARSSQEIKGRLGRSELENLYQYLERQAVDGAIQRVCKRIRQAAPG